MAIYKVSYSRIEYQDRQFFREVDLGSILVGELNFAENAGDLERYGREKGISTITQGDEMLAIQTQEFTVEKCFDWNKRQEYTRASWEFVSAESL